MAAKSSSGSTVETVLYIALWYALNVGYNIYNKDLCNNFPNSEVGLPPLAWTVGTTSLAAGLLWVTPIWLLGIRKVPKLGFAEVKSIMWIAFLHLIGHFGAVVSMSLGAVSFTHIVKAAEPVFSTILTGLVKGSWAPWKVNATLFPIIFGVVLASVKLQLDPFSVKLGDFNPQAFAGAMISNLAFALRSIYMKGMTDTPEKKADCEKKGLTSANIYAVYTIFAFIMAVPLALFLEGKVIAENWPAIVSKLSPQAKITTQAMGATNEVQLTEMHVVTGLFFYLYNEASSLALGNLDGVAHAVCNTVKRVVIMVAMSVFDKPLTAQKWTGAGIAIGGTLLYTMVKNAVAAAKEKAKKS